MQTAVVLLRRLLAAAVAGGPDPSKDDQALELLGTVERCKGAVDDEKLAAFCAAVRDPSSVPGVNRAVVLARGQRFLTTLALALEEEAPSKATLAPKKKDEPEPAATFDPAMLDIKGIGPKTASRMAAAGIASPTDLLFWLPRRYDDRRTVTPLKELTPGRRAVTRGIIERVSVYGRPWKRIMDVLVTDPDDPEVKLSAMWFSNRRPRSEKFTKGTGLVLAGQVNRYKDRLQMPHPVTVEDGQESDLVGRIVPVYAEISNVPGRTVEKAVSFAASRVDELISDPMPEEILSRRDLMPLSQALRTVHLPPEDVEMSTLDQWLDGSSPAHRRLAYDEFFFIQLALSGRRGANKRESAPPLSSGASLAEETGELMGFSPTGAQKRSIEEIAKDLSTCVPMRRLLQGDVGSGKTMVALAATLAAVRSGYQVALMAPTEILAEQHMRTLYPLLKKAGATAVLHLGQARSSTRKKNLKALEAGTAQVAIGTHALIQESVRFNRLALTIVDEQHRFGVAQRLGLVGKGPEGSSPHLLVMTATPIPRTLALTVHGDLDCSVIDELPPGRKPIETSFLETENREEALLLAEQTIERGEQVYVVCPIIEESEKLDVANAEQVYEDCCERFGEDRTALLHGRLPPEERDRVMDDFKDGRVGILVSTTVIEVGVDIPNATLMIVEGAQRFGLAQLHQLRGRVGRSHKKSTCALIGDLVGEDSADRMEVLVATNDGFEIAEADLRIRGPGELYGRRQAGLPGFRFGNLARDKDLLEFAREDVESLVEKGAGKDSVLEGLREELARRILAGDGPVGEEAG